VQFDISAGGASHETQYLSQSRIYTKKGTCTVKNMDSVTVVEMHAQSCLKHI